MISNLVSIYLSIYLFFIIITNTTTIIIIIIIIIILYACTLHTFQIFMSSSGNLNG